ncbi:ATPase [Candidatus Aerophobetes bacterium Ae_b3a]|nr:MAG: ATPase [Candidatus Aerophobetes bacterium Ae_b3a]
METAVKELQKICDIVGRKEEITSSLIAARAGKHILLEGAVGVGKTTIALAVASYVEREFVRIDGDERYTEQKLAGWFDPPLVLSRGYTGESFIKGPLSTTMQEGEILLINELNRMPEGTQNVLLTAMDEKTIFIPKFGRVDAKEGFLIIATQNPDEYIGTSQLSEALKDRFICIRLSYQSEEEEKEIVRMRSRCNDEDIIDVSVALTRLTRDEPEIRRGSSIRGAIDTADIFQAAHRAFNDDINSWLRCAGLAFRTKIELHDFSEDKFGELLKKLVSRALAIHGDKKASVAPASNTAKRAEDTFIKPETDEKKK